MSVMTLFGVSETDINGHSKAVLSALDVTLRPDIDERIRYGMLQVCQDFKEKYPLCLACGLQMTSRSYSDTSRHFGLQIVEHCTKFFWSHMAREHIDYLKTRMQMLILNGLKQILAEKAYIKDVTARIMVEIIKNDWPFMWPNLLMDLDRLAIQGEVNMEVVMLILLRLSEDVVIFDKGPLEMRSRLKSSLKLKMTQILNFILRLLDKYVIMYRKVKSNPTESYKRKSSCSSAIAALRTLAGYLEWIDVCHITENNCKVLHSVLLLLNLPILQLHAAECLCNAVVNVGKLKSGKSIMTLFDYHAMRCVCSAAETEHGEYLTESKYLELKKICELVCVLGVLLTSLVGPDPTVTAPPTFDKYLSCLLQFTSHSSQTLRFFTQSVWLALFNNPVLNCNPQLLSVLPNYLSTTLGNLQKVGFPSKNDDPSCQYARFDFAGDDDFREFFADFHAEQRKVLKVACRLDPKAAFQMASEKLKNMILVPVEHGLTGYKTADGDALATSTYAIRSEALTYFLETVISEVFQELSKEDQLVENGVQLLQLALNFKTTNPFLLFCSLTNVATLCPFLLHRAEFSSAVLRKFFAVITMNVTSRQSALKNVRKYACATLSKICRENATLFMNEFQILYGNIKPLVEPKASQLTIKEKCFLIETLIMVCNQFKDYEGQKAVLEEVMAPVTSFWLSEDMQKVLLDPKKFIDFIGGNVEFTGQLAFGDPTIQNCSQISYCTSAVVGLLSCFSVPSALQGANDGYFVIGCKPNGDQLYWKPCSELFLNLFDRLLDLIRIQQNLFLPDVVCHFSQTFAEVLNVPEVEKPSVHELPHPLANISSKPIRETKLERKQTFLITLYENCFHILGLASVALRQDFYNMDDLNRLLLTSAFANLNNLSDHRISIMLQFSTNIVLKDRVVEILALTQDEILNLLKASCKTLCVDRPSKPRHIYADFLVNHLTHPSEQKLANPANAFQFVKPLVLNCPPKLYEKRLVPILGVFLNFLHERLTNKWFLIDQWNTVKKENYMTEIPEDCDTLENHTRQLTRDVMAFVSACCFPNSVEDVSAAESDYDEMVENERPPPPLASTELTELGICLMKYQDVRSALMILAFSSLTWKDDFTCYQSATKLCWSLFNKMLTEELIPSAVLFFYSMALKGLEAQGEHKVNCEALVNLAFQFYVTLRPRYSVLKTFMRQVPDIMLYHLDMFDVDLCGRSFVKKGPVERKKIFIELLKGYIQVPFCEPCGGSTSTSSIKSQDEVPPTTTAAETSTSVQMPATISENVSSRMSEQKDLASSSSERTPELKDDVTLVSVEDEDEEVVCDPSSPVVKSENIPTPSPSTPQWTPGLKKEELVSVGGDSKELKCNSAPSVNAADYTFVSMKSENVHSPIIQSISPELEVESCLVSMEDDDECESVTFEEDSEMACEPPPEKMRNLDSRSRKWRFHSPPRETVGNPLPRARKTRFDVPPPGLFQSGKLLLLLQPPETVTISTPPFKKLSVDSPPSVKTDHSFPHTVKPENAFGQLKEVPPQESRLEEDTPLVSMEEDSD